MANASGFYLNLLKVQRYWDKELAAEGMMQTALPVTHGTNGTWLTHQAVFSMVRSMISRDDTWHPRYCTVAARFAAPPPRVLSRPISRSIPRPLWTRHAAG